MNLGSKCRMSLHWFLDIALARSIQFLGAWNHVGVFWYNGKPNASGRRVCPRNVNEKNGN